MHALTGPAGVEGPAPWYVDMMLELCGFESWRYGTDDIRGCLLWPVAPPPAYTLADMLVREHGAADGVRGIPVGERCAACDEARAAHVAYSIPSSDTAAADSIPWNALSPAGSR